MKPLHLLQPGMAFDVNAMRPYFNGRGESCIAINGREVIVTNAPTGLRYDEWKDIDRTVIETAKQRLVGIAALVSRGLVHSLGSVGISLSQFERMSDITGAQVSMSGITAGEKDSPQFSPWTVPIPVVFKDWSMNWRQLEASRRFGTSLDTISVMLATRVVAERSEDMLFSGESITLGDGTVYGYRTHPHRNTVTLSMQWTNASKTGAAIIADVQAMLAAARADNMRGPFTLYIPAGYEGKLDDDYNPGTSDTRTIRQRLLALEGIAEIVVADRLTAHNVLLVQLTSDVVDLAVAQDITPIQWDMQGGLQVEGKVMAVWAPRIKSDFDGRSGIVHLS